MGSRSTALRTKVLLLVGALVLLWSFAAWVTVRDGLNLYWVQSLNARVYEPSEPLLLQLQEERRLSTAYLGNPTAGRVALDAQRAETDTAAERFRTSAGSWQAGVAASSDTEQRVAAAVARMAEVRRTRAGVDAGAISRADASTAYTAAIDSLFRLYESLGKLDDQGIAETTATLIDYTRGWELMSREDALLAGVLAARAMTSAEHAEFTQLVGAHRFQITEAVGKLPQADQDRHRTAANSESVGALRAIEERIVNGGPEVVRQITAEQWQSASMRGRAEVHTIALAGGDDVIGRAVPVATGVILRLVVATGLGLVAIILAWRSARRLVEQMTRLGDESRRLSAVLPGVVDRIGRGETVDLDAEAPPMPEGDDEIGQVGRAFNGFRATALDTAVQQARLRRGVRDLFLNLARRTQSLVHRQLTLLWKLEEQEQDAATLERLYEVDHIATRVRRNSENLIVMAGATVGRQWRRDVLMFDVVRGAVQEVEQYKRVDVAPMGDAALAGRAVVDLMHLLAELIDNALTFSPPTSPVQVRGQQVANGYAIEVEDRGLGMPSDDLATRNELIAAQPEFDFSGDVQHGLFVVSHLAVRHAIRVQLKPSPYGGITAVVLIPSELVSGTRPDALQPEGLAAVRASLARTATDPYREQHPPSMSSTVPAQAPPAPSGTASPSERAPERPGDSGLPQRVRSSKRQVDAPTVDKPLNLPDPARLRERMSAFQDGTRRGRAEPVPETEQDAPREKES